MNLMMLKGQIISWDGVRSIHQVTSGNALSLVCRQYGGNDRRFLIVTPDHWIPNPNWGGLGPNFGTSLGQGPKLQPFSQNATRSQAPDEILSPLSWEDAMKVGEKEERWILINIQDPTMPKCQALNREIWNDIKIVDLLRENFLFLQCRKDEYRARHYIAYHFPASRGAFPHIAIVDPREGEQLKVWSGLVPKPKDFLDDLHQFLEMHSLNPRSKKPAGRRSGIEVKEAPIEPDQPWHIQPVEQPHSFFDDLYGASDIEESPHGKTNTPTSPSPKTEALYLSHSNSRTTPSSTTIINFCRLSGRQITHTFSLSDPVRALFEWLESREIPELKVREGRRLCLGFQARDLSEFLDERIADIPGLDGNGSREGSVDVVADTEPL